MVSRARTPEDILNLFVIEGGNSEEGLSRFLGQMLRQCAKWFAADSASIFLAEGNTGLFTLAAQEGKLKQIPMGSTIESGRGLAGKAVANGEPALLQGRPKGAAQSDIASSIIVPLSDANRQMVGVINLARGTNANPFDERDLKLAEGIARYITMAVTNARLVDESRQLSEMLKSVLAHTGFGIICIGPDDRVQQVNPEWVVLLGHIPGPKQSLAQYLLRLDPEIAEALKLASNEALKGQRYRKRLNYRERVLTLTATPLPSGGATLAIQDVTELESAHREHERLKRLAEVGQMTATIAHEIRNPLTGIRSAAQMVKETPELSEEFADIIEVESIKLNQLCDEFLEFARPLRLELAHHSMADIIRHVAALLEKEFNTAQVALTLEITKNEPIINVDLRRMEQVIRNLVLNALQATKAGGRVFVSLESNALSIVDTGVGIDKDTVIRLFSPFFTTKPKGTGLGLSMVKKIIDAHEMAIEIRSEPGVGTQVKILFERELEK